MRSHRLQLRPHRQLQDFPVHDFFRRYLKFGDFGRPCDELTDVDDKTINGANREGLSLSDYTERYIKIFFDDLKTLNIEQVEHTPRATESIDGMIDLMSLLNEKGIMYEKDGSLYFSIKKFESYGRLSRLDSREIRAGARYDADEYDKDDVRDFALWKASKAAGRTVVGHAFREGAGRAGISSARRWYARSSAARSTCIPAASI
jgi:cysteinyl-tRNA synthetase